MNQPAEEFGDYLMARGRIQAWRVIESRYRDEFIAVVPGPNTRMNACEAEHALLVKDVDLPRAMLSTDKKLLKMYFEERIKEA